MGMQNEIVVILIVTLILAAILITFLGSQRAWGETSLMNLFKGQDANSNDGDPALGHKALHVKINKKTTSPEVYEFHLSDQGVAGNKHIIESSGGEKTYFTLRNWNQNKCVLFASSRKSSGGEVTMRTLDYVYYINPGTMIEPSCNSLYGCVKDGIFSSGCENICAASKETSKYSDFSICGALNCRDSSVLTEDYYITSQSFGSGTDYCNDNTAGCPSEANGGCCPLVGDTPSTKYTPQYGLICGYEQVSASTIDPSAKWFACTDDPGSKGRKVYTAGAGGAQYSCNSRNWIPTTDQGIDLENVQIKYDSSWSDEYTALKFYLANHNKASITDVSIKAKITNSDIITNPDKYCEGVTSATIADCTELNTDKNKDASWAEVAKGKQYNSEGLTCPISLGVDDDDFCWKAKTFNAELKYKYSGTDKTDNFKITCSPPNTDANGAWHNECTVEKT
ncbi:MAG: hypothetical protein WA139_04035 [Candidatus Aenigmatarchaeota archaeon]